MRRCGIAASLILVFCGGCNRSAWLVAPAASANPSALERIWDEAAAAPASPAEPAAVPRPETGSPATPVAHVSPAVPSSWAATSTLSAPLGAPAGAAAPAGDSRPADQVGTSALLRQGTPSLPPASPQELLRQLAPLKEQSPEEYALVEQLLRNPDVSLPPLMQAQIVAWALYRQMHHRTSLATAASSAGGQPESPATAAAPGVFPASNRASPPSEPLQGNSTAQPPASAERPDPPANSPRQLAAPASSTPQPPPPRDPPERAAAEPLAESVKSAPESVRWSEHVARAIANLQQEIASGKLDEADAMRAQAQLRLLHVLANQPQQAVAPIEVLDESQQEYWKHQLHSLLLVLDVEGRHAASRRAALSLRDLRQAVDHLADMSTLDVRNLAFCSEVQSFGRYVEFPQYDFRPEQEVLLYVEVENFAAEQKNGRYETELHGVCEIFDSRGQRVATLALPDDEQVCNNRRRDYFIAYPMILPAQLEAGRYTLQLTIEDLKGGKSSQTSLDFKIRK